MRHNQRRFRDSRSPKAPRLKIKQHEAVLRDQSAEEFWAQHEEDVRPKIQALDHRQVEDMAKAPFIVVTNGIKKKKKSE